MKLKNFVISWVILLSGTMLAGDYVISEYIVSRGFEDLEKEHVVADTLRVRNELRHHLHRLDTFLWDWASWDDTFDFVFTSDAGYMESNLQIETFLEQSLNAMIIRDNSGDVVFGRGVDEQGQIDNRIVNEVLGLIRGVELPPISDEGGSGGILTTSFGPMQIAVRPILLSSGEGKPAGTFLMGRLITRDMLESISSRLGIRFSAHPAEKHQFNETFPQLLQELETSPTPIPRLKDADTISGFVLIRDLFGLPSMILEINAERKITKHGNKVSMYMLIILAAALAGFSAIIVLIIHKRVINRVERLNREVKAIDLSGHRMVRVSKTGNDEISQLAGNINTMLVRIEEDQAALNHAREGLEKEVAARTQELQEANRELKSLDKAKSRFLSATSHELRTPLTAIHGFIKLMKRTFKKHFHPLLADNPELSRKLSTHLENYRVVNSETERLGRLIDDMLDLNKIEAGKSEWRDETVDPAVILNAAADSISGQFKARPDVKLLVEVPGPLPLLYVDKDRIHQVLINLLNNAAKFTEEGYVKIGVREGLDAMVEFFVEDTGSGISPEDMEKLFEPFYQAQRSEDADPSLGTGLGLAICRQIVTHYGGTIRIESEPNKGSTFIFTIPAKH